MDKFTFDPQTGKIGSDTEFRPREKFSARLFERPFEKLKNTP